MFDVRKYLREDETGCVENDPTEDSARISEPQGTPGRERRLSRYELR